jgi:probable F420-dependent oxidoreductase
MIEGTGIWSVGLRYGDPGQAADAAAELESLGYTALWIPDTGGDVFGSLDNLLSPTSTITVATGILNVWCHTVDDTNAWWAGLSPSTQERVMLGLGVSHGALIGQHWGRPLATMRTFLDGLDVPGRHRCLGALGPKMLELARTRTAGSHPYLSTPEHTAMAREALGPDALLAPEQGVVLETDPDTARTLARGLLEHSRELPIYIDSWKRLGFTDEDISTLSDRLVDALIVWGDVDEIAARVAEHRAAGANHVCLQVIDGDLVGLASNAWRALAGIA